MRKGLYLNLAWTGIRKNKTLYFPYLLSCILMVSVFYILDFLSENNLLDQMAAGTSLAFVLHLGSFVIAAFSVLFLFYTNSFLIRRRKKEFGLYHVLGMDKWNITRILLLETLMVAVISIVFGLVIGIALSKLSELALVKLIGGNVTYSFSVSATSITRTLEFYGIIFLLILLNTFRQIRSSNSAELLKSENVGEKPPKANWVSGLLGLVLLGGAYCIAVSIQEPVEALFWFFIAVIMVIAGTYLLFIAGSVLLCRILQKSKKYYYQARHFVSVSSMTYRMKRNGAGLASICILATMVLVMISSSACLYFGSEDGLQGRFPRDLMVRVDFTLPEDAKDSTIDSIREKLLASAQANGAQTNNILDYSVIQASGLIDGNVLTVDNPFEDESALSYSDMLVVNFVSVADYNKMYGTSETLADGDAMVYSIHTDYKEDSLQIRDRVFRIVRRLDDFNVNGDIAANVLPSLVLVVNDPKTALGDSRGWVNEYGECALSTYWYFGYDTQVDNTLQEKLLNDNCDFCSTLGNLDADGISGYNCENMAHERADYFGTFGGLFFIGIMLSLVFLLATVLIIYYKQLCEGYEDQARFDIMQRVGMTKKEIRKSINSQMLTVFLLPLLFAALHLVFAFPMIWKLIQLFHIMNKPLLILTTIISILVFGLFYTIVYRVTSNAYYGIVSGAKE